MAASPWPGLGSTCSPQRWPSGGLPPTAVLLDLAWAAREPRTVPGPSSPLGTRAGAARPNCCGHLRCSLANSAFSLSFHEERVVTGSWKAGHPGNAGPPGLLPAFGPLPTCGSSCCFCPSRPPAPQQYAWYGTHTHLRGDSAVRALSHVTDDIARRVLPRPGVTVPRSALRRKLLSEEKGLECLSANGLVQPPVGKLRRAGGSHLPPSSAVAQVCLGTIRDRQDAWTPSKPTRSRWATGPGRAPPPSHPLPTSWDRRAPRMYPTPTNQSV